MKNLRATVVLEMVFAIQEKGYFSEDEIVDETGVSRSTFFRCLSDLRCYLQEHRPYMEIVHDPKKETYVLVHQNA